MDNVDRKEVSMKQTFIEMIEENPTVNIWENIDIDKRIDKDVLTNHIESCLFSAIPLYTNINVFKRMTERFFTEWKYQITKLLNTQEFEYNPIWNKDGTISEKRNIERDREEKVTQESSGDSQSTAHATNVENEAPYNTDKYHTKLQNVSDSNGTAHTTTDSNTGTNETESTADVMTRTETGNIGLTSTQELIRQERGLYDFNIYEWITAKFEDEMFILVF